MRFTSSHPLWTEQRKVDYVPAIKIEVGNYTFTLDWFESCSNSQEENPELTHLDGGRIWYINHVEEPWRSPTKIILSNHDKLLTDANLEGEILKISYGAKVLQTELDQADEGDEALVAMYSACAPLRVRVQRDDAVASNGKNLTTTLHCKGMIEELDDDKAVTEYVSEGDETLKTLLTKVLTPVDSEFTPFEHCADYILKFDSEDNLLDTVVPGASFTVQIDESRLQVVAKIMEQTYCVLRAGYEEPSLTGKLTLHIFKPVTDGPVYDYEYSLDEGDHGFWAKTKVKSLVVPNYITVTTPINALVEYEGYAKDVFSYNRYPKKRVIRIAGVDSDATASNIAEAILSKVQQGREVAAGMLPVNFGAEVYDYSMVTDIRDNTVCTGNLGHIQRIWDAKARNPNVWTMSFSFGGWLDVEKIFKLPWFSDIDMLRAEHKVIAWYLDGDVAVGTKQSATFSFPYDLTWTGVWTHIDSDEAADADIVVDINVDGVSIHTDSLPCTIIAGQDEGYTGPNGDDVVVIPAWSKITMDVDAAGSTAPGTQLTVEFFVRFDK